METYLRDTSQKLVKIQIQAGVVGIAETRVFLRYPGKNFKRILKSESFSGGNIPLSKVDVNNNLLNATLRINTSISLENIPNEHRKAAVKTILMIDTLVGGPEGSKSFMSKESEILVDNPTDPLHVEITKRIRLI